MNDTITIFTAPKPFRDPHIDLIQRNAIRSWLHLGDRVEIFLIGEEEGLAEAADEFGVLHLPDVKRNEWGTPRVDSIFALAREASSSPLLAYLNADILLPPTFVDVVEDITRAADLFLAVGRRWDLTVEQPINVEQDWPDWLHRQVQQKGVLHGPTAMDYFIFPREIFLDIPPFAIGRAGWDNWMIYRAQQAGWTVLDITPSLSVVHQEHDYAHLPGGKPHYKLDESHRNVELGGGFDKVYDLLDVENVFQDGKILSAPLTLPRVLRKMERWIMPPQKAGWRWKLTRHIRQLRRKVT